MRRLGLFCGVAAALALPASASATDFSVTTLADLDGGVCGSPCSLRQAIKAANTSVSIDGSGDVIRLPAGRLERNPAFAAVEVTAPVVLVGAGARATTISGSSAPGFSSRALSVLSSSPIDVELRDLTVAGGLVEAGGTAPAFGGGISARGGGSLTLRRVTVRDNQALAVRGPAATGDAVGGGVFVDGALTLDQVTIRDNRVATTGSSAAVTVGGGAFVTGGGSSLRNSTVASNAADGGPGSGYAGGLYVAGATELKGVTLAGNGVSGTKAASGGNLFALIVTPTVSGSIIADGRATGAGANCARALVSGGGNVEDAGSCGFTSASDRAMSDPRLGPLQDNGGPTDTRALLAGSPAIDLAQACAVDVDQRGTTRPQGPACDAGAFELEQAAVSPAAAAAPPASRVAPSALQRCTLGLGGNTRRLRARIHCELPATVRLTGRATIRPRGARGATRRVRLRGRTLSVGAVKAVVVRVAVPRTAIRAVRRRAKVTIALTATQLGAGSRQTARIARLEAARRKERRATMSLARSWAPIASGGMNISDQVGLARTSDRVLHVAWRRRAAGQDLLQTPITPSGRVGSPVTVVSGWAAVGSPALVARGTALSAFFPGSATLTTGDPTYGLDLATSGDAGASWSVSPTAIARNEFAFARTPAAVLTAGGNYLQAWYGTDSTVVHAGLDPAVPPVGGYGAGSNQALAAADDGQAMVAWCDQQGVSLARVDAAGGTRIGGVVALPDTGRCGADTRIALASNGDTPRAPGAGDPYFYSAAASADGRKARVHVVAGGELVATSTLAAGGSFKQQIAIATENRATGSVWVCWRDSDANALACRRYSNPRLPDFTFGAKVVVRLPPGQTMTQLALDAQDDRVDAVATMSDDDNVVGLFATQVFPGLTLQGSAKQLKRRGFRVLDNGEPIRDATVRVAGRAMTTNRAGYAKIRLRPGRYTATASKPRYSDASLRVRVD